MKWFEGNIPSAIQQSKEKRAVFIVYISGKDDMSTKMDATWEDERVSTLCERNQSVALRLEANSETVAQFCMIYPVVCVPCTYFIGENGVPLEVTGGHVPAEDFVKKIEQVSQMHQAQLSGQKLEPIHKDTNSSSKGAEPTPATTPQDATPATVTMATTLATTPQDAMPASASEEAMAVEESSVSSQAEAASEGIPGPSTPNSSLDERVTRAKELIQQKQAEKAAKEAQEAITKEKERIRLGKDLKKLQEYKEEQARKEMMDEWKKEKEEKKKEKERIREQLARDREEKAQKFRAEREERERQTQEAKKARLEAEEKVQQKADAAKMERARIQFRLPDGSALTQQFSSSDTLQAARDFLNQNVGNTYGYFTLSTLYPKRDFIDSDLMKTMLELNLAPSAVVVVLPGTRSSSSSIVPSSSDNSGNLLSLLFAPFLALWAFLRYLLFSSPTTEPRGATSNPTYEASQQRQQPQSTTSQGARPKSSYGLRSRREGNITRLSNLQDDDDEDRTTWNGNSTQQM